MPRGLRRSVRFGMNIYRGSERSIPKLSFVERTCIHDDSGARLLRGNTRDTRERKRVTIEVGAIQLIGVKE